jgi:hypothetical protein
LQNGAQLTFWTRTVTDVTFPDRLQVRMSTNECSSEVGSAATSVGDFTTLLLDINPTLTTTGYPTAWTQITVMITGLAPMQMVKGRLAFRYLAGNAGPGIGAFYIGIDSVDYHCNGVIATPTPSPGPTIGVLNLSTRLRAQTGPNVGVGGLIITGTAPKNVLIRAIGPSLTQFGVPDVLADPVLELHGPGAFATITNNNWRDTQAAEIQATGIPPTDDLESAIRVTLNPGAYTAIIRGNNGTSGVGLIEVYDLNPAAASKLANLSTRAFVSTGSDVVIAGFLLSDGNGSSRIILRGIGPSLAPNFFPVSAVLADPTLELRDANGALLISDNDWQDNAGQAAEISAAGLAPGNNLEAAMAATLSPGPYTAILAGLNNGTGIGLVEVYDLGP